MYGAGIPNLARQIGMSESAMAVCVAKFKSSLPDLDNLITGVQSAAKKNGYLLSVDGRWGRVRSSEGKIALNTALNVLLQMTGSLVMKWAHVRAEDTLVDAGYIEDVADMPIVAHVHDEGQFEIEEAEVETMEYYVPASSWDEEEKRQHVDKDGRIWSAPIKMDEIEGELKVSRSYHIVGDHYCKALEWAGKELGLRCATAGEYKIGDNWHHTH